MGACYTIQDANPKGRTLGYTMQQSSLEFGRNLRLVQSASGSRYYEVTEGAGTNGEDRGYCAANDYSQDLLTDSDYDTLYQVKYNSDNFDLWFQGNNACNTDGCNTVVPGAQCTLYPEEQQPLCYLLSENGKNKWCSEVDSQINPIYYLTFGGNVSYQALLMFYPMILLLSICVFVNLLCFKPKLIWGGIGDNKYRSVKRKMEVFENEDEECEQGMLAKGDETDNDL